MNAKEIQILLRSMLTENLIVQPAEGGFLVQLPFLDYMGEPMEIFATPKDSGFLVDDLGHTAGLLYQLGQHSEEAQGHLLIKNLAEAYHVSMDYNRGLLSTEVPSISSLAILDFVKVILSSNTVLPEMQRQRKRSPTGKRLGPRLARDIHQLRLPQYVERHAEVEGKHETWIVDYRYRIRRADEGKDVLIVAVDLGRRDPKLKAEHVLTLALDVLQKDQGRDLRVVYDVDGRNGAVQRAANLISDYQERVGYRAFNYSDPKHRREMTSLTLQELSPMAFGFRHGGIMEDH